MRIDFHAHVLPGLDHGCSDIEMAKNQLKYEKNNGIEIVIATSHFYPHLHTVNDFLEKRSKAAALLNEYVSNKEQYPKVIMGAEVLLCNNLDRMPGLKDLCIDKTNILLVEFPLSKKWDKSLIETVLRIKNDLGLQVVLAHADRYDYKSVSQLLDMNMGVQLNIDAICSIKKRVLCKRYVNTKKVVALGSDIHGFPKRSKKFNKAMKILGTDADDIMKKTSELLRVHIESDK